MIFHYRFMGFLHTMKKHIRPLLEIYEMLCSPHDDLGIFIHFNCFKLVTTMVSRRMIKEVLSDLKLNINCGSVWRLMCHVIKRKRNHLTLCRLLCSHKSSPKQSIQGKQCGLVARRLLFLIRNTSVNVFLKLALALF